MQANELVVVHEADPKPSDLNLIKLAVWVGVPVRGMPVAGTANGQGSELLRLLRQGGCLAMSASTLRQSLSWPSLLDVLQSMEIEPATKLFIYGFRQDASDSQLVRHLSGGAVNSVGQLEGGTSPYSVSNLSRLFCHEFSGLTF